MGKTKTAVISGFETQELSGAEKYKLKQRQKAEKEAAKTKSASKKTIKGAGLKGGERIKVVGGDISDESPVDSSAETPKDQIKKAPKVRGKKHVQAVTKIDKTKLYSLAEAISLVKETSYSKFDGTVEMHAVVKANKKKERLSVQVTLPHSAGKSKRIEIASDKTLKKLKDGKVDFDVLLATADMMPRLVPFAKLLGPRGLMPNPKNGTLIKNRGEAKNFSENQITVKTEKSAPLIHIAIGKVSQKDKELSENAAAILKAVGKGKITKCYLCSTMGPSVKVKVG